MSNGVDPNQPHHPKPSVMEFMPVFDALPEPIRNAIRESVIDIDPRPIAEMLEDGTTVERVLDKLARFEAKQRR